MSSLRKFIEEELEKRKRDYLSSPGYIIEHYNAEKANIQSYNGRQLLEMLQNADDAAESATEKKVLIRLKDDELIIANNGSPFNQEGIYSILYSNHSYKSMQQNKIGYKGLGFRSILSWAREVVIASGGIVLGFSREYAQAFLENIMVQSEDVSMHIHKYTKEEWPIATLRVPMLLNNEKIIYKGYDTVIALKLNENILDDVQSQILSLINKETLVFLNNLEVIEIDSPLRKITFKKSFNSGNRNCVTVEASDHLLNEYDQKTWNIRRRTGEHLGKGYELAVAWSDKLDDSENVLYSYFRTQVRFPFPALLHGTFELSPNRNHLINDTAGHNKFLVGELANLLVDSSLDIAANNTKADYRPLALLNIDFERTDQIFIDYNFKDLLLEKIKNSNIFPTVNGDYINYEDKPVYYESPVAEILKGKDVPNLMLYSSDKNVIQILEEIECFTYTIDSFISLISKRLASLSVIDLAKLIYSLLSSDHYNEKMISSSFDIRSQKPCLIDIDNKPIPWNSNIFVIHGADKEFSLPKSLNIRFVNAELVKCLAKEYNNTDIDYLVNELKYFRVKKYSFNDISATLVHHYNSFADINISSVVEMHKYLFRLYKREVKINSSIPRLGIVIKVLTINKKVTDSDKVYFGKRYENCLIEQLYSYDKSKLLASSKDYRLEKEDQNLLKRYFSWIGIEEFPRYKQVTLKQGHPNYEGFKEYLLRNFDYKLPTDRNDYFKDYNHLQRELISVPYITVGYFDDLSNILANGKYETLFEWIKKDERLRRTLEENTETLSGTRITLILKHKQTSREYTKGILSFTKWLFATTTWIPVESSAKKSFPDKCCLSKTISNDFSPFVEKPKINLLRISEKLELSETVVEHYLTIIGVHREISSFSVSALYEVLVSLPMSDKEGKVARKIYREIISNFDDSKIDSSHPAYKKFFSEGKILCQKGGELAYFPVKQTYYLPTKSYGSNILKLFPLAMIDGKQGSQKIEKLFGVKRLKGITFEIIGEPILSDLNIEFKAEIERFKGLVYVLRMHKDKNHEIANRLKRLKIYLAKDLKTSFTHIKETLEFELENYEYIHHKDLNKFYISVPDSICSLNELHDSNKFCQSIAEIFSSVVETEEYHDFIHDLYSKKEINRLPRLLSFTQKEDDSDFTEAKVRLNIIDDVRFAFWRAFAIASEKNIKMDIRDENELLNFIKKKLGKYSDKFMILSSSEFIEQQQYDGQYQELIYNLFIEYKVDFKSFARHYSNLDFANYFKNKVEDYKALYKNEFARLLHISLSGQSSQEKMRYFELIEDYSKIKYRVVDGFIDDVEKYFLLRVEEELYVKLENYQIPFSIEGFIEKRLSELSTAGIEIPAALKEMINFQIYLLFDDNEEICAKIQEYYSSKLSQPNIPSRKQVKVGGKTVDYDDYHKLTQMVLDGLNINNLRITVGKVIPQEERHDGRNPRTSSRRARNVKFDAKNEEQIGFIAELICYHKLLGTYGETNVTWVSENAYRAYPDKFLTSEAGKGYDFELKIDGQVRYIETKGVSHLSDGIHFSANEIKTALEFPEKYDLLVVEDPLGNQPEIKHVKAIFRFKKGETLFSNSKIKVYNDNYIVKFNWVP